MRVLLCLLPLSLAAGPAAAEVVQSLEVKTYDVPYRADISLRKAIRSASPIRHGGKTFHGFTRWHVNWQLWWTHTSDGGCALRKTQTRVNGVISLPVLQGAPDDVRQVFDQYLTALRRHEMGHYQFALDAAQQIDRQILALPPQATCTLLESTVNGIGKRILDKTIREEIEYDRRTRHGQTEGVTLPP
jgi:predicted secreted Zn-dependent protease